jgi:NADH-quinone oxidoreductase subunit L
VVVFLGLGLGWKLYGGQAPRPEEPDVLERPFPGVGWLRDRLYVDEFYGVTVIAFYAGGRALPTGSTAASGAARWPGLRGLFGLWAQLNRFLDTNVVDGGFDKGCEELAWAAACWRACRTGRVQTYLRILALAVVALVAILIWSSRA